MNRPPVAELLEIAATTEPLPERAGRVLASLAGWLRTDTTRLDLTDPGSNVYATSDRVGLDRAVRQRLEVPLAEPEGPHLGMLTLSLCTEEPPASTVRRSLSDLAPLIARAVSPMRSLLATARLVEGATSGAVVLRDGTLDRLPGLRAHELADVDDRVVQIAVEALLAGHVYRSFMWPVHNRHVRITVLTATDVPRFILGTVLVAPGGDCRGLTPRELQVLGLLMDGRSNHQIARRLAVAPRTVAAHMEHILRKLDVPTRTLAAVRAEREGCYVPGPASHVE